MPSSATPSLRIEAQATGENVNLWGVLLDQALAMLDAAIAGMATIALAGDYTLIAKNFVADEARNAILKFTGTLAANAAVTIPSVTKLYVAWNATNKVVTITTGAGSTVPIDAGDIVFVFCDAVNVKTLSYGGLSLKDFIAASVLAATGTLPALTGNAGKYIYTDGTSAFWRAPVAADIADFEAATMALAICAADLA